MNRRFLEHWDGEPIPDANEEYLLYQALVGTWPLEPFDDAGRQRASLAARPPEPSHKEQ